MRDKSNCADADITKARLYFNDGVDEFREDALEYSVWLALPKGVRCAFRGPA